MKVFTVGYMFLICFLVKNVKADEGAETFISKLVSVGIQCVKDYPLTLSEMKAFKNKMVPDGENPKCFAACVFKDVDMMDNMGMFLPAGAQKNAEQVFRGNEELLKNANEIVKVCTAVNDQSTSDGNKGCDRAKLLFTCLIENAPKYGFNFDF